jgi:HupE/UreJ protein
MSVFVRLGFQHILTPSALDHLLFLLVLAAPYRLRDWRHLLGVASAFTLGHSVTLALVASDAVRLPTAMVEFLIPVTIVGAALGNLRRGRRPPAGWAGPLMACGFGLIHGAGFANFLHEMFSGSVILPLFGFNLGIELGQITVLASALLLLSGIDRLIRMGAPEVGRWPRALMTSLAAAAWAAVIAVQRAPW